MEIEQKDCSSIVDKLVEKYSWIATEKQLFGKSGTDYDFQSCEPHKAREELENLQAQQSRYIDISIVSIIYYKPSYYSQHFLKYGV